MKIMKCPKCGKTWYRYFDKFITEKDLPHYCPHCEADELKKCDNPVLRMEIVDNA